MEGWLFCLLKETAGQTASSAEESTAQPKDLRVSCQDCWPELLECPKAASSANRGEKREPLKLSQGPWTWRQVKQPKS